MPSSVRVGAADITDSSRRSLRWRCPPTESLVLVKAITLRAGFPPDLLVWTRTKLGRENVRVLRAEVGRMAVVAQSLDRPVWRMEVGDVNRDGLEEIVVGLYQRSKLDPRPGRRIYVYGIDSRHACFKPLWRGSALSRPFRDFILVRASHGSDLASIETEAGPSDHEWLSIYTWNGFGFRRSWDTPVNGRMARLGRRVASDGVDALWIDRIFGGRRERIELSPRPDSGYSSKVVAGADTAGPSGSGLSALRSLLAAARQRR